MTTATLPGADALRQMAAEDTHGHFDAEAEAP